MMHELILRKISLSITLLLCSLLTFAQVSGTVYRDFNANGQRDAGETFGVPNVSVKVTDATGTSQTVLSDATGAFSIASAAPGQYRVEFMGLSAFDYSGPHGSLSGTSVQFVTAPATGMLYGVNYPGNYCQTDNPPVATTCFLAINIFGSLAERDVTVGTPFQVADNSKNIAHYSLFKEVGSVWGLAYKKETGQLFQAAFTKRHVGFGPGGPGAIYVTGTTSSTATSEFFNFGTAAGTDMHTDVPAELINDRLFSYDIPAFDAVGKTSLGDIELSDDGQTLWVVNLFNRRLYALDVATKDTVSYAIPNPGCQANDYRPFGLKFYRGKVYVSVTCSNESTPGDTTKAQTANMTATVYSFAGGSFSPVLSFPLNYDKAPTNADKVGTPRAEHWHPWTDTFRADRDDDAVSYPQPWLTDIEFDGDGTMILGLRDRYGDQIGFQNRRPIADDQSSVNAISPGELLRAGACGPNGTYLLESNGSVCGSVVSAQQAGNRGPGGGKYYWGDRVKDGDNHGTSTLGSMAFLAGSGKLMTTAADPTDVFNTGGLKRFVNASGAKDGNATGSDSNPNAGAILYTSDPYGYGKANGLGDLALFCDPAPLEIGNRVWNDSNANGIQDAGESGIAGVPVQLYKNNVLIASTTTDADGTYYFNSTNVSGGLLINMAYQLQIPLSATALTSLTASVANSGADNIDSDGTTQNGNSVISLTTGGYGENDHTYDFGFRCLPPADLTASASGTLTCATLSVPLSVSSSTTGVTYAWSGPINFSATSATTSTTAPGLYTVVATVTATGCTASTTVLVFQNIAPPTASALTNSPVCQNGTIQLTATLVDGATYAWSGPNSFSANGPVVSVANATPADAGVYSLTVTLTGTSCISTTNTSVIVNPLPAGYALTAKEATCSGATSGTDGAVLISGSGATDRYDISTGATYTGAATYAGAKPIPANGELIGNLSRTGTPQTYTVRVYNESGCFVDKAIGLKNEICTCPPAKCVPYVIKRVQ